MKIASTSDHTSRIQHLASYRPKAGVLEAAADDAPLVRHADAVDVTPRQTSGNLVTPYLGGLTAQEAVDKTLAAAKTSIQVEIYRLGYDKIVDVLANQARNGVKVQVLMDPTPGYSEKDAQDQRVIQQFLKEAGVEILKYPIERSGKIDHVKMLIVDGKSAVIGGLNWDSHSRFNMDTNVTIEGPAVQDLSKVFVNDWKIAGGGDTPQARPEDNPPHPEGDAKVRMMTTDVDREDIRKVLMKNIRGAKRSIRMMAFALADKQVIAGLIDAHKRGVDVQVLLDPTKPMGYVNEDTRKVLSEAGIDARYLKVDLDTEEKMHAKVAMFDDDKVILGSANFTSKGLSVNHEASVEVISKSVGPAFTKFFDDIWDNRSLKRLPDLPELDERATEKTYGEEAAHTLYSWFNKTFHADNPRSWVGSRKLAVLEAMKNAGEDPKPPGPEAVEAVHIGHLAAFLDKRKIWEMQPEPDSDAKVYKARIAIATKAEQELPARVPEMKSEMLSMVKDGQLKDLLKTVLDNAPEGYYKSPSTASGLDSPADESRVVDVKPHFSKPSQAELAKYPGGGLVLHSRRNMEVAEHLCDYFGIKGKKRDEILVAEALTDVMKYVKGDDFAGWKPGEEIPWGTYPSKDHGSVSAEFVKQLDPSGGKVSKQVRHYLEMHQGYQKPDPSVPSTTEEMVVALSEFLASQRDHYVKV